MLTKSKLTSFVAQKLKPAYGDRAIGTAAIAAKTNRRVGTGSLELDYSLGGGFPIGRICLYYGEKSGGKTTTAKRQVGINQKLCRNCFRSAENIQSLPPSAEDLAEDPEARWSATGECDCYAKGIYEPEEPEIPELMELGFIKIKGDKKPNKNSKVHKEALQAWKDNLTDNSYEEYVCVWIDTEHAWDNEWADTLGVDCNRLLYVRPESAEEAIDIMCAIVLTVQCDLLVVDSIAQLVPQTEIEESMTDWQQGLQARLVNKAVRKLVGGSNTVANQRRTLSQIWINQTRINIGMRFGDPTVKPAGKGQDFAAHVELKFENVKIEMIDDQWGDKAKGEAVPIPIESKIRWRVTKNRTAPTHGVSGSYRMSMRDNDVRPRGTIIEDETIFKMAMHYLVDAEKKTKSGPTTYTLAGKEFTNQKALAAELIENQELLSAVRSELLDIMLNTSKGKKREKKKK